MRFAQGLFCKLGGTLTDLEEFALRTSNEEVNHAQAPHC